MRTFTTGALCSLSLAVSIGVAAPAWSEQRVGVVTTIVGPVTVARASMPAAPLKFKDDIFLRDRVTTGDDAITRILLGGKVIVTARERSTLVISEVPGLSTIDLTSGRIAVAVDRTRMKPGERVEVRTPNAIAGVRGTVFIVEADAGVSTVTVLRGLVDVVRLDPRSGVAVGAVTPVSKHHAVTVRNTAVPPRPKAITPARAESLSKEFAPPLRPVAASRVMPVHDEVARATALLGVLVPAAHRQAATTSGSITTETTRPALGSAATTGAAASTPPLAGMVPPAAPLVTTTLAPTTSLVTTSLAPATSLVPTTSLIPTVPSVPTTPLAPASSSSSGGLLSGVLSPVTGLLK
jgi:hypothetical protein